MRCLDRGKCGLDVVLLWGGETVSERPINLDMLIHLDQGIARRNRTRIGCPFSHGPPAGNRAPRVPHLGAFSSGNQSGHHAFLAIGSEDLRR
jgi:hypothetical protein